MKRTPLWVFVAAVGIQIAALGLCIWAMENFGHLEGDTPVDPEERPVPLEALNPAPPLDPIEAAFTHRPQPAPAGAPVPPPAVPLFGPPPARSAVAEPAPPVAADSADDGLRFIVEAADDTTQILQGQSSNRTVAFGFYPDGNIRFVDVDAARYAGKADSARARMREVDGTRAFTVQIGVGVDGRLQATFTGGLHDDETLSLEPLVGWSVA